jgi:hypothetical protein
MSSPDLAAMVYRTQDELQAGEWLASNAERTSDRRVLTSLQKQGSVVKLGNIFHGKHCSYANRETAVSIIANGVKAFGKDFLEGRPVFVRLYTDSLIGARPNP